MSQKMCFRFSKQKIGDNHPKIVNPKCTTWHEKTVETSDFVLSTSNISSEKNDIPKLHLSIGPKSLNYIEFVKQGWNYENGKQREFEEHLHARMMNIKPKEIWSEEKGLWFSIDNDEYEVKPVKITLLPRFITMFCKTDKITH